MRHAMEQRQIFVIESVTGVNLKAKFMSSFSSIDEAVQFLMRGALNEWQLDAGAEARFLETVQRAGIRWRIGARS